MSLQNTPSPRSTLSGQKELPTDTLGILIKALEKNCIRYKSHAYAYLLYGDRPIEKRDICGM